MHQRLIIDKRQLDLTLQRLCQELIENHGTFSDSVILGLQPRGIYPAKNLAIRLSKLIGNEIPIGFLDSTFFRDDFRRKNTPLLANSTHVPFLIENKKVILVDDVLYTGRSVRASMDAMNAFGRPSKVELLVLIDRKYARELPIEADYVGRRVNTLETEKVLVEWEGEESSNGKIWIMNKANS
jgi:pyrimidine operon attenuation protein/uracil phosphoribosyltransferase